MVRLNICDYISEEQLHTYAGFSAIPTDNRDGLTILGEDMILHIQTVHVRR